MKISKMVFLSLVWMVLIGAESKPVSETAFVLSEDSEIRVKGTSSMHDWSMEATSYQGSVSREVIQGSTRLTHLIVEVEVGGLTSGKSGMEKDARKTLGAESFPSIRFEQSRFAEFPSTPGSPQHTSLVLEGTLQIRDQRQAIQIDAQISISENTMRIKGSHTLNMTDYGVDPPRALLGLIKTGEVVEITFDTIWLPS